MDANIVTVQAPNGTLIFQSDYNRSTTHPEYLPFSAYAPAGVVTTVRILIFVRDNTIYDLAIALLQDDLLKESSEA